MSLQLYIKNRFGSKRGLIRTVITECKRRAGVYKKYEKVDLSKVKRLIFICSGNICRSPLGEAVAKLHGINAESFGLDTRGGDPADPRAINYAAGKNIDLNQHRTRYIDQYSPLDGDLLIGMEPMHIVKLRSLYSDQVPMTLAGLWLDTPAAYLHDPFNACPNFFSSCSSLVEQSAKILASKIKQM